METKKVKVKLIKPVEYAGKTCGPGKEIEEIEVYPDQLRRLEAIGAVKAGRGASAARLDGED